MKLLPYLYIEIITIYHQIKKPATFSIAAALLFQYRSA